MQEGEAQKIDTSSMEYYKNIDEKYLDFCKAFDPTNEYAVPYLWGTVGILYNTKVIKEKVDSWSILWDKKYDDQIVMQNSMRDAFMVPLKWNGISLNTTSQKELKQAQSLLLKQKPIVEAYLVDEARDAMVSGDASMAVIYSGDATVAMEENEDLDYVVPKEGSNVWFCLLYTSPFRKADSWLPGERDARSRCLLYFSCRKFDPSETEDHFHPDRLVRKGT